MGAAKTWARRFGAAAGIGLIFVVVASFGEPPLAPVVLSTAPPDEAVAQLFDGLRLGEVVQGWTVAGIFAEQNRPARVELGRDGEYFSVGVVAKGASKDKNPMTTSERYEFGCGFNRPEGAKFSEGDYQPVLDALVARVKKREAEVPKPVGL